MTTEFNLINKKTFIESTHFKSFVDEENDSYQSKQHFKTREKKLLSIKAEIEANLNQARADEQVETEGK